MTITITDKKGLWQTGVIDDFWFAAKVYDEPSDYGINNGRISKLEIQKNGRILLNYDRGWDIRANKETRPLLKTILNFFK